ncbi:hypothetical protein Aab01nite_37120 [Paractinoplanes abujensis]|uniref:Uncharacterized protein n=1 Tax=Paractinoplanes abujensis TaxID=882441 RepID=A0A7W7CTZ2_9ACTN|nr:hypothetical protein [Actinoplanes abujensis]MBB4694664.1 hypothetical protein [Actinoplanes abujensis]GID20122.1 hypothetical protein Aab01nite_37120 [Actinoplanes abujensis]
MEARKSSAWKSNYVVTDRGREIATWDKSTWKSGGEFTLDGRRYRVRSNGWGSKYTMTDDSDTIVATAERVGRKRWSVSAGGQTYDFRRKSLWASEEELVLGDTRVGSVRKTSWWGGTIAVELPGLPPHLQLFVLGVVISKWDSEAAAAAASSSGGGS